MAARYQRIAKITLDEHGVLRRGAEIEHERATAIFDLLEANSFAPVSGVDGPFHLHLAMEGPKLLFDIRREDGGAIDQIVFPLTDLRPIIRDYFFICESYNSAVRSAPLVRITALDQGRRALHNEAGEMLREGLAAWVAIDFDTARRLFTLICVLQIGR